MLEKSGKGTRGVPPVKQRRGVFVFVWCVRRVKVIEDLKERNGKGKVWVGVGTRTMHDGRTGSGPRVGGCLRAGRISRSTGTGTVTTRSLGMDPNDRVDDGHFHFRTQRSSAREMVDEGVPNHGSRRFFFFSLG
jgi:hypothetical protein